MVNFMIIECKDTKKIAYAQVLCDFCLLDAHKQAAI